MADVQTSAENMAESTDRLHHVFRPEACDYCDVMMHVMVIDYEKCLGDSA
jgi:hypothetical protein